MKDFSLSVNNLESAVPPTRLVYQLTRSKLLRAYLRKVIIRETLDRWEQSSKYQLLPANTTTIDDAEAKSSDIIDRTEESNSQEYQRTDRELLLRQYQQSQWGHLITTRFLERKSELDRVLFSAIQVADLHLAHELYCRVCEQGKSFTNLATLYSQRPAAKMGGAVGPIPMAKLHPLIHHHLIGLKPKQISPIFQLDEQYVFLKLECWLPARFDRQMQQQLLDELFEEWLNNRIVDRIGTISCGISQEKNAPTLGEAERSISGSEDLLLASSKDISTVSTPESTYLIAPTSSFFFPIRLF